MRLKPRRPSLSPRKYHRGTLHRLHYSKKLIPRQQFFSVWANSEGMGRDSLDTPHGLPLNFGFLLPTNSPSPGVRTGGGGLRGGLPRRIFRTFLPEGALREAGWGSSYCAPLCFPPKSVRKRPPKLLHPMQSTGHELQAVPYIICSSCGKGRRYANNPTDAYQAPIFAFLR